MASITPLRDKLAKVLAMLSANRDQEQLAAVRAINRVVNEGGCSIHDLVQLVQYSDGKKVGQYSEADLQRISKQIYDVGFAEGQQFAQQQAIGIAVDWPKIVAFVIQYIVELSDKARELAKSVQLRVNIGRDPSEKQAK